MLCHELFGDQVKVLTYHSIRGLSVNVVHGLRQVGEELLHSGYAFDLYATSWEDPEGESFDRDIVRHRGAVAIVPITNDGRDEERAQNGHRSASLWMPKPVILEGLFFQMAGNRSQIKEKMKIKRSKLKIKHEK